MFFVSLVSLFFPSFYSTCLFVFFFFVCLTQSSIHIFKVSHRDCQLFLFISDTDRSNLFFLPLRCCSVISISFFSATITARCLDGSLTSRQHFRTGKLFFLNSYLVLFCFVIFYRFIISITLLTKQCSKLNSSASY